MPEEQKSAMPCGCDPGINYISPHCEQHRPQKSVVAQFACGLMLDDDE